MSDKKEITVEKLRKVRQICGVLQAFDALPYYTPDDYGDAKVEAILADEKNKALVEMLRTLFSDLN